MADDPTIQYQPPRLGKVHFGPDSPPTKPLYPIIPKNPPVVVVTNDKRKTAIHEVYGTENIEYLHVDPESNSIKKFTNEDAKKTVIFPESNENETEDSKKGLLTEKVHETSTKKFVWPPEPIKEPGFADRSADILIDYGSSEGPLNVIFPDSSYYDYGYEYSPGDQDIALSETNDSQENLGIAIETSVEEHTDLDDELIVSPTSTRPIDYFTDLQTIYKPPVPDGYSYDTIRFSDSSENFDGFTNDFYESQVEKYEEAESGTSFYKKAPPPSFYKNQKNHISKVKEKDNENYDKKQEDNEDEWNSSKPWFLIDTKSDNKNSKKGPSIASYIRPETHNGGDTIHYMPNQKMSTGITRHIDGHIHNHHLDDHMNSYKPANSITANSLSELLQIFKYTMVTEEPELTTQLPPIVKKGWRYTKPPTTPTPEPSTRRVVHYNTFRYTTPTDENKEVTSPLPPIITTTSKLDESFYLDRVAETNSLDGYLFSDSEAAPEYARPETKPNTVTIDKKDEVEVKGVVKDKVEAKVVVKDETKGSIIANTNVTRRGDFVPSGKLEPLEPKGIEKVFTSGKSLFSSAPQQSMYVIIQGHSKVKMFGTNSVKNPIEKEKKNSDFIIVTTHATTTEAPETLVPFTLAAEDTPDTTTENPSEDLITTYEPTTTISSIEDTTYLIPSKEDPSDFYYDYEDIADILQGFLENQNGGINLNPERLNEGFSGFEAPWIRPHLKYPGPFITEDHTPEIFIENFTLPPDYEDYSKAFYSVLPSENIENYSPIRPTFEAINPIPESSLTKDTLNIQQPEKPHHELIAEDQEERSRDSKYYPVPKPRLISDLLPSE